MMSSADLALVLTVTYVVAAALGIDGAVLLSLRRPLVACAVWVAADVLWVIWGIATGSWAVTGQFAVYLIFAVVGV